ncbi:MAG: carbohydrate binding family 9 domain-containing protein [Rhodanobacter sp.]
MRTKGVRGWLTLLAMSAAHAASPAAQSVAALRISQPVVLDGRLLEAAWTQAQPIDRFYETWPVSLAPPPERTEARLLYDDEYLYVGLRMHLRDPARLRKPFVRRDKVNFTHDYVQVYLDPQGTRRGSYLLRVNARGTRADGYQNEAQESETLDPDWDWDVVSHVDAEGWSAEMRIPLSTLRIARRGPQRWTVVVTRGVPREQNTQMASAPFPHDSNCFLCHAGTVYFPDLAPETDRLLATPGATLTRRRASGSYGDRRDLEFSPSLDAKWLLGDSSAVDLTVHPDFSQVEADAPQLTANRRFALDLPEKRPFFREGLDLITTAIPVVYTRAIAAPQWGLRYTRRSAGVEGTTFVARDFGRPAIIEPGFLGSSTVLPDFDSDDAFARARGSFAHGDLGGLVAIRRNDDGSRNLVAGADGSWSTSRDRLLAQVLGSSTRNPDRPDLAAGWRGQSLLGSAAWLEWNHAGSSLWNLRYQRYDPGFRSWLGYVPRVGYQALHADYYHPLYSGAKWVNTINPYASLDQVQGIRANRGRESDPALGLVLGGYKGFAADLSWHGQAIVLDARGRPHAIRYVVWTFSASPGPRIPYLQFDGQRGEVVDYATGDVVPGRTTTLRLIARPLDRLELEGRLDRSTLDGAGSGPHRLTETARQLYATWHFSARMYALLTWQHYASVRRFPVASRYRNGNVSAQFNWYVSRDLQFYWGIRTGAERAGEPPVRGRGTEVYMKATWIFRR